MPIFSKFPFNSIFFSFGREFRIITTANQKFILINKEIDSLREKIELLKQIKGLQEEVKKLEQKLDKNNNRPEIKGNNNGKRTIQNAK